MRKRILYLSFILSIVSFISFYSCKHNSSSPSIAIQQKGDKCYFLYQSDSNFCFSECNECPGFNKDDIEDFNNDNEGNTRKDIIEKLNTLCPLAYGTTSYLDKKDPVNVTQSINWLQDYIDSNKKLSIKELQDDETFLSNTNKWHIDNNLVMDKCSRDKIVSGTVLEILSSEEKDPNYINAHYKIGKCSNNITAIAHISQKDGKEVIDYMFVVGTNQKNDGIKFSDIENNANLIPNGCRLPNKNECNIQIFKDMKVYYEKFLNKDSIYNNAWDFRFWINSDEDSANICNTKIEHYTCRLNITDDEINVKTSCSKKDSFLTYLVLFKDDYSDCKFQSYLDYILDEKKK